MATIAWPWYLPQNVTDRGFSFVPQSNAISTAMSHGYAKVRKRTTKVYKIYSISIEMNQEELYDFELFFENDLGYGVLPFTMFDPLKLGSDITCQVVCSETDSPYNVAPLEDNDTSIVSFKIEILE